jgi:hypothetical protein
MDFVPDIRSAEYLAKVLETEYFRYVPDRNKVGAPDSPETFSGRGFPFVARLLWNKDDHPARFSAPRSLLKLQVDRAYAADAPVVLYRPGGIYVAVDAYAGAFGEKQKEERKAGRAVPKFVLLAGYFRGSVPKLATVSNVMV